MNPIPLINKRIVNSNSYLKTAQKQERRANGKGSRKPLKNYIGKVVSLSSPELIGDEPRVSNFVPGISREDFLTALESVDITGMSGNGFPIYKKITSFLLSESAKKVLLINAVECDPALMHDKWLLDNRYAEITHAIHYLTQALSLGDVVLATKNKYVKANSKFSVSIVPPRYPMGEEHFLIRQALGIPLNHKEIPAERGILVLNLQSVYQIGKIVNQCYDGGRFVTIADLTKASAKIAYVYPTDNLSNLLRKGLGGADNKSLYRGHGIMSCTEATGADDFSKHENFAAYANPPGLDNNNKCKRCGSCTRKCPANIKAAKIVCSVDSSKSLNFASYQTERCIKCGSCTYFCPAFKNVSGYVIEVLGK